MRYIPTIEYYSTIERNEVLIHVMTWTSLENIMLRVRSQTQRIPYLWLHLYEMSRIAVKKVNSDCPGLRKEGNWEVDGFPLGVVNVLELDKGNGCIIL